MDKIKRKIYLDKIIEVMKNDFPLLKNMELYGFYDQLTIDELDYVFSEIFDQPVKVKGYGFESDGLGIYNKKRKQIYFEDSDGNWVKFVYDENNNRTYLEDSDGYWRKYEYDKNGNEIYWKDSDGVWEKSENDKNGNKIYSVNSNGDWKKWEYDENGNMLYYEDSDGEIMDISFFKGILQKK